MKTKLSILMIDDDSLFVDIIAHRFERTGHICTYVPSGTVALEMLAKNNKYDVILLDLHMPDMDGFEVLSKLKSTPQTASIPVIVFSNEATEENMQRAKGLGAATLLEKVGASPKEVVDIVSKTANSGAGK